MSAIKVQSDNGAGLDILGPRNPALEAQNPNIVRAPVTDSGSVPNLKFSYATAHNRVMAGGWAREVTTRELPVATELSGVNMRLKPGRSGSCIGIRRPSGPS